MAGLTSVALGLAAAGAVGGAIAGGEDNVTTSQRNVAGASPQELELQKKSMESYLQALNLQNQQEADIGKGQGVQDTSRNTLQDVIGGDAFNINPEQQSQVNAIRQAAVDAGTGDIQNFVNENLSSISNSAGVRGLRGQALSELQGRSIGEGARQVANLSKQANLTAAQQALDVPFRQAQLQGGLANNNANFMENLRQQAIQNRTQLQNPALMQSLQQERFANATTTNTDPGSFGKALAGAAGGAGSGLGAGASLASAMKPASSGITFNNYGGGQGLQSSNDLKMPEFGGSAYGSKAHGGMIEGRAKYTGDTIKNDVVPTMLSPGEMVIPRTFAHDPKLAKAFIDYMHRKPSGKGNS